MEFKEVSIFENYSKKEVLEKLSELKKRKNEFEKKRIEDEKNVKLLFKLLDQDGDGSIR